MSLTKITDYMKLSKQDRQKHIDLSTPCQFYYFKKDWGSKKEGDLYNKISQMKKAKSNLLGSLNIEDFGGREIQLCHLCNCNSNTDKVCINPAHLYFGTVSENQLDKPLEVRQIGGKIAMQKMTKEQRSKGGKIGVKKMNEKLTKEQRSKAGKAGALKGASKGGKIGGKKCAQLGKGGFKQKVVCPHCCKEGKLAAMKRWHFDNCKFKYISKESQNLSNLTQESSSTNLE